MFGPDILEDRKLLVRNGNTINPVPGYAWVEPGKHWRKGFKSIQSAKIHARKDKLTGFVIVPFRYWDGAVLSKPTQRYALLVDNGGVS